MALTDAPLMPSTAAKDRIAERFFVGIEQQREQPHPVGIAEQLRFHVAAQE